MAEPDPQVSTDSWRDPFTRFSGESEDIGAQLRDAGLAFAVQEQLRTALTELADHPLSPEAGARVRYLLGEPAAGARAALGRMNTSRKAATQAPTLSIVAPLIDSEGGAS